MGIQPQQEFKSVKPCTKPKRKVIPFNDHSIGAWKPKKDKDKIGFQDPVQLLQSGSEARCSRTPIASQNEPRTPTCSDRHGAPVPTDRG